MEVQLCIHKLAKTHLNPDLKSQRIFLNYKSESDKSSSIKQAHYIKNYNHT